MHIITTGGCIIVIYNFFRYIHSKSTMPYFFSLLKEEKNKSSVMNPLAQPAQNFNDLSIFRAHVNLIWGFNAPHLATPDLANISGTIG